MKFTFEDLEFSFFPREPHKGGSDFPQLIKGEIPCPSFPKKEVQTGVYEAISDVSSVERGLRSSR